LSDEEREQMETNKQKAIKSGNFFDAVNNPLQSFGSGTSDLSFAGLGIKANRNISWQLPKLDSIMRDVPYFDKASSWKATRVLMNGIDLNSSTAKTEELTITKRKLFDNFSALHAVIKLGDYYGGAGGLIVCDDTQNENDYMQPLVISKMSKGSFKGIKPLSRLYQIQPDLSSDLVTRVGDDVGIYNADEIGQPLYYMVNLSGDTEAKSKYFRVHRSRLLLYSSLELSWVEKRIEMYFGPSLLERSYSDFARYESMLAQVNKLAQRSNIPVLNVMNLPQASLNGQRFAEFVTARIKGINFSASAGNMILLGDKDKEEFKYENAEFQQIPEILEHYQRNLAGTLEAPSSELFNTEVEDDAQRHFPKLREIQEGKVRNWFNKLIPLIYKNEFNKNLKDFGFKFKSLEMTTEKEKSETLKLVVDMLDILYNDNVIDVESMHHMLVASQDNVSDMFNEMTKAYREYAKSKSETGEPMNKLSIDIQLATALNHLQGQGEGGTNLSHKVESSHAGQQQGGDPAKTKKPTVKLPMSRGKE
jgi:phage-related protein (TIGR01555 family)